MGSALHNITWVGSLKVVDVIIYSPRRDELEPPFAASDIRQNFVLVLHELRIEAIPHRGFVF